MDMSKTRNRLLQRQAELRGRSDRVTADLRHERDPLTPDFADQAVQRANDDVLEAIGESAKIELAYIGRALLRLDAGTYGDCAVCGGEIATARLEAIPYTDRCTHCAEKS